MVAEVNQWRTQEVEDFLRTVYILQQATAPVSLVTINRALRSKTPYITYMVQRLGRKPLAFTTEQSRGVYPPTPMLEHELYHGIRLTPAGEQIALQVIRRRRLIELYLLQKLGYTWDEVEFEADQLEHALSDRLTERLAAAMDNPNVDPHGDPIPTAQGNLLASPDVSLADGEVGQAGAISRIADHSPELLQYFGNLGLRPGIKIRVLSRAPLNDIVTIKTEESNMTYVLSTLVAAHLHWIPVTNVTGEMSEALNVKQ